MYIKAKSDFNILAAETLIKNNLYAPSVHCSYYGCFQLMKYKLKECCKIPYPKVDSDVASSKTSEHNYIKNKVQQELKLLRLDKYEIRDIMHEFSDLKEYRTKSDYKNIAIDSSVAYQALKYSKSVIDYISGNIK